MKRPPKPGRTIRRAKAFRRQMSPAEVLLWQRLKGAPEGIKFRKQHPAGRFVLDFFCARANLAMEVDGDAHDMSDRPRHDAARDAWLRKQRIDTIRIRALEVFAGPDDIADAVVRIARERLEDFGKAPPSAPCAATSPTQVVGEDKE